MARPMKPLIRGGGYYPSRRWTPLVYPGGYTTANGGEEPAPPPIEKTVTGNPIHILDALAKPAQALSIALEPIQDLNGYDNPWPSGGGKNKLDAESTFTNPTAALVVKTLTLKPNTQYTASTNHPLGSRTTASTLLANMTEILSTGACGFWNGTSRTKTTDENGQLRIAYRLVDSETAETFLGYNYQLEEGSTASSWTPYSNICPISGWTGANVTRTGKNLLSSLPSPTGTIGWFCNPDGFLFKAGNTYCFSSANNIRANSYAIYASDKTTRLAYYADGQDNKLTYTPAADIIGYPRIYVSGGLTQAIIDTMQLEVGHARTEYESPTTATYSVAFPSDAGTVYGGTLDVTQGKLTVDRAMVDLGSFGWSKSSSTYGSFYATSAFHYRWASDTKMLCSRYKFDGVRGQPSYFGANGTLTAYYREDVLPPVYEIYIKDESLADKTASEFQTEMSGVQLVYELATPITIQLSPQQVELLQGENNIWSDGEMILVYLADGNASDVEALNILLGGRYVNNHGEDEPTDREALDILLGGNTR